MPIPAPGSLLAEKAALARGGEIDAAGKDLGGTRLLRRGRSLGGLPRRDLPRRRPPIFAHCIAITVCPGACAGEFLLGAVGFLRFASKRDSTAYSQKIVLSFLHFFRYAHKAGTPPAGGSRGRPFSGRGKQKIRTYRHNKRFALHIRKPDSRHGLPGFLIFDSVGLFICNI